MTGFREYRGPCIDDNIVTFSCYTIIVYIHLAARFAKYHKWRQSQSVCFSRGQTPELNWTRTLYDASPKLLMMAPYWVLHQYNNNVVLATTRQVCNLSSFKFLDKASAKLINKEISPMEPWFTVIWNQLSYKYLASFHKIYTQQQAFNNLVINNNSLTKQCSCNG